MLEGEQHANCSRGCTCTLETGQLEHTHTSHPTWLGLWCGWSHRAVRCQSSRPWMTARPVLSTSRLRDSARWGRSGRKPLPVWLGACLPATSAWHTITGCSRLQTTGLPYQAHGISGTPVEAATAVQSRHDGGMCCSTRLHWSKPAAADITGHPQRVECACHLTGQVLARCQLACASQPAQPWQHGGCSGLLGWVPCSPHPLRLHIRMHAELRHT